MPILASAFRAGGLDVDHIATTRPSVRVDDGAGRGTP